MEGPERMTVPAAANHQGSPGVACVRRSHFAAAGGLPAGKSITLNKFGKTLKKQAAVVEF
jgi:hypothetical protein